jgi:hypothetical protein
MSAHPARGGESGAGAGCRAHGPGRLRSVRPRGWRSHCHDLISMHLQWGVTWACVACGAKGRHPAQRRQAARREVGSPARVSVGAASRSQRVSDGRAHRGSSGVRAGKALIRQVGRGAQRRHPAMRKVGGHALAGPHKASQVDETRTGVSCQCGLGRRHLRIPGESPARAWVVDERVGGTRRRDWSTRAALASPDRVRPGLSTAGVGSTAG